MTEGVPGTLVSLLDGLIDYAGLYPPANHDMDEMVRRFDEGLSGDADWMLGRVIVPVKRLDEFEEAAASRLPSVDTEDPWCLSVLVSSAESESLESDIERLAIFNERHCETAHGLALADVIELKASTAEGLDRALDVLPDDLFPFFELPAGEDNRGLIAALAGSDAAAKIRTGGVTPELNPSTFEVARFVHQCIQAGVPFKATAGLHHPLPNENAAVPAHQQGFLNVFSAAVVAAHHDVDVDTMIELLDLTEGLVFEEDRMQIGSYTLEQAQVEDVRAARAISFGSCSWEEPLADLQALGLLPRADSVKS